jgi:hypothetical protein
MLRASIVKWAEKQADMPTLSEATRRLVELGLKAKTPARPVSKPGRRLRAQELATKAIEKIIDPAAAPEERAQRRRRTATSRACMKRRAKKSTGDATSWRAIGEA